MGADRKVNCSRACSGELLSVEDISVGSCKRTGGAARKKAPKRQITLSEEHFNRFLVAGLQ